MNEHIKELAEQAETWNADGDKCEVDLQKFAQLIVLKCAYIGEQYADGNYDVYNNIVKFFGMQEPEE